MHSTPRSNSAKSDQRQINCQGADDAGTPRQMASDVALYISDWFRISFMIFLSSESRTLMGIKDTGEWKNHAVQAFKSILHLTVRNSLKTQSPIPDWGLQKSKNRGTCSECAATV
jgi:hypothetical protein